MDTATGGDELDASADALAVTAEALAAALGVRVQGDGADPPTYRFRLLPRFADGLTRRAVLDLGARRFRTTLWAGDHRCLDHLELADHRSVSCDTAAGRLILESATAHLVLSRHGALTVVPVGSSPRRAARRRPAGQQS